MPEKKKNAVAANGESGQQDEVTARFITASQLNAKLESFADGILDAIDKRLSALPNAPAASVAAVAEKEAVAKAGPDRFSVNDEWEEDARNVLGDALAHTEVVYERNGGIKYTVVVARKFSNAPQQYLDMVGTDRRTKEVGSGGFGAVQEWNKLVKQNLSRPNREMRAQA